VTHFASASQLDGHQVPEASMLHISNRRYLQSVAPALACDSAPIGLLSGMNAFADPGPSSITIPAAHSNRNRGMLFEVCAMWCPNSQHHNTRLPLTIRVLLSHVSTEQHGVSYTPSRSRERPRRCSIARTFFALEEPQVPDLKFGHHVDGSRS
jgi:hypothetical protein